MKSIYVKGSIRLMGSKPYLLIIGFIDNRRTTGAEVRNALAVTQTDESNVVGELTGGVIEMFEIGTKFWFGGRLFRIANIVVESKSFPQTGAQFTVQLDERRADGEWVYVGRFTDITPDSLVDGLRTGEVEISR